MEYLTPNFTKDMLKDYTVLVPNMCPVQFLSGQGGDGVGRLSSH